MSRFEPWVERARARKEAALDLLEAARARYPLLGLVLDIVDTDRAAGGALLAAALAFRIFLWVLPAGLLFAGLLGFLGRADATSLSSDAGLGSYATGTIASASAQASEGRWLLVLIGVVTLFWASGTLARTLYLATCLAWRLPVRRFRGRTQAATGVIVSLSLVLVVALAANWLRSFAYPIGFAVTLSLLVVFAAAAWVLLGVLPHPEEAGPADLLPGAILIGVGTQGLHLFTTLYLGEKLGTSSELYGALGGAATILLWAYIAARILVAASTLNRSWMDYRLRRPGSRVVPGDQPPWTWHTIPRSRSGWKAALGQVRAAWSIPPAPDGAAGRAGPDRPGITAWTFEDPQAALLAAGLVGEGLVAAESPRDWGVVTWAHDSARPTVSGEGYAAPDGELGPAFWGLLFGLVFFAGGLTQSWANRSVPELTLLELGLGDGFVADVRNRMTPGSSALFVLGDPETEARVDQALAHLHPTSVRGSLSGAHDEALRTAFAR